MVTDWIKQNMNMHNLKCFHISLCHMKRTDMTWYEERWYELLQAALVKDMPCFYFDIWLNKRYFNVTLTLDTATGTDDMTWYCWIFLESTVDNCLITIIATIYHISLII